LKQTWKKKKREKEKPQAKKYKKTGLISQGVTKKPGEFSNLVQQ